MSEKPLGMQRAAIGPAEHETMIGEAGAHDQPLGQLLLAMPAELGDRARIQGDGTPAPGCLRGTDSDVVVDLMAPEATTTLQREQLLSSWRPQTRLWPNACARRLPAVPLSFRHWAIPKQRQNRGDHRPDRGRDAT
jgi:hypothetical protein